MPGCDFSMGGLVETRSKYLQWRRSRGETLYVGFCNSCKIPWRKEGGVFLYIFLITPAFPVSSNIMLWLQESISLSALLFYLSIFFYIPPSTHFAPLMSFFPFFLSTFLCTLLFSQVNPNMTKVCTLLYCAGHGAVIRNSTQEAKLQLDKCVYWWKLNQYAKYISFQISLRWLLFEWSLTRAFWPCSSSYITFMQILQAFHTAG